MTNRLACGEYRIKIQYVLMIAWAPDFAWTCWAIKAARFIILISCSFLVSDAMAAGTRVLASIVLLRLISVPKQTKSNTVIWSTIVYDLPSLMNGTLNGDRMRFVASISVIDDIFRTNIVTIFIYRAKVEHSVRRDGRACRCGKKCWQTCWVGIDR